MCLFLIAIVALLAMAARAAEEYVADELLVCFQPGARAAQADQLRQGMGATRVKAWPQIQAEHWKLPPGLGVSQAIRALAANPNVLHAEPNFIVQASDHPNDPRLPELWAMHNFGQTGGTPDADADALEAWQMPPGGAAAVVGVIDTGVDYTHEDLAGRIWTNPGEIPGNGTDDDGNGYVDDVVGWDFVNNDNDPMDDKGHGTHVAGTIAAEGNNGLGVIGVAGLNANVKLMPLKFLDSSGYGSTSDAISCILYAASFEDGSGNKIVRITSNSYGGSGKSKTEEKAIKNSGALFVAAAGNDGSTSAHYPAAYSLPNIVAVAASDQNDVLASFSNYSSDWVHLAAPGVSILSTLPGNTYGFNGGTSMATPHVSGLAALLLSQYPGWSIDQVREQILNSVDFLPTLTGLVTTGGRLNAARALGAGELPPDIIAPAAVTDLAASPASARSVTLTWTAPGDDGVVGTAYFYDVRYSWNPILTDADFDAASDAVGEPSPQPAGAAETFTIEDLTANATRYFAVKSVDEFGNVSPLSNTASATTPPDDWYRLRIDYGQNVGNYASLGITSDGSWSVASEDSASAILRCAVYVAGDGFYRREIVGSGGIGASLAYDATGLQTISHVDGSKLLFETRIDVGSWTRTQIEGGDVNAGDTSLVYNDGGDPVISYFKTGRRNGKTPAYGLWLARRSGSAWSTQSLDADAHAVYNQLAAGPAGELTIAYSGGGSGDTLKVASYDGAAWSLSTVEAGGSFATVAYDLISGYPAVAHVVPALGQLRFLSWNGAAWTTPEIVDTGASITGCSLAFAPDGRAFLAYGSTEMRLAIRDPASGTWSVQVVDEYSSGGLRNSVRGRPLGTPSAVAYRGPAWTGAQSTVQLALRQTPY